MRLVMLGTKGGPAIRANSAMPSSAVLFVGGIPWVIDAGYGVTRRLVEAGADLMSLRHLFITHHHSDHNLEAGPLLVNAWATGLRTRVDVWGPPGIDAVLEGAWIANRFDIVTRIADEGRPDLRALVRSHRYAAGSVMEDAGVTVTALRNHHPPVDESFALKFSGAGRTIVFSGDTAYHPPLAEFARGADVLVHEVMYPPGLDALAQRNPNAATLLAHLRASHTSAADVGRIAAAAGVKRLVLNHFVPADDPSITAEMWAAPVRENYKGEVIVGRDLMEVPLG